MGTTVLIDSDILAYKVASTHEEVHDFGDTGSFSTADLEGALAALPKEVESIRQATGADRVVVCLSDPTGRYFRKDLYPAYKSNRKSAKPALLQACKAWLADNYESYIRPGLEADDIMGILATHPKKIRGRKVIASDDKDMRTIPGVPIYSPRRDETVTIGPLAAAEYHLLQTLTGDSTDGYPGCPGVGPVKAQRILAIPPEGWWAAVVEAFVGRGLTEEQALTQARMARILRAKDYDFRAGKPRLWTPADLL
jgi:DNA polymerase-1